MNKFSTFWSLIATVSTTDYNPAWANGTGYFNGVIVDELLKQERAAHGLKTFVTTSVDNHGRKMLIIVGEKNSIVFFQRFSDAQDNDKVIVNNASRELNCSHLSCELQSDFIDQWFTASTEVVAVGKMVQLLEFLEKEGAISSTNRKTKNEQSTQAAPEAEAVQADKPARVRPFIKLVSDNKVVVGSGIALAIVGVAAYAYYNSQRAE